MNFYLKYLVLLFILNFSCLEGSKLFRCDYLYSSEAKGWFKHHDVPATWADARLQCDLEGAVLASPTTQEIKAEMMTYIMITENELIMYGVFTGIHATFAKGAFYTIDGVPLSKIPHSWARDEPDNKGNNESCLIFYSNGELEDLSCEETRPFICYRSENQEVNINECGTIDSEYRLDARTNKCYKFHPVPRIFTRALFACAAEGGHLAIINSNTEAKVLSEIFAKYPERTLVGAPSKDVAFVGIRDRNKHGDWRTIHGQTLAEAGFGTISPGNPNNTAPGQYCGAIHRFGQLDDVYCDRIAAFFCEKSPDYYATCASQTQMWNDTSTEVSTTISSNEGSKLFRCDYEYSSEAKGWFKHHVIPATWADAQLQCDLEGAILASPTTPEIKSKMTPFINSTGNEMTLDKVFTGIHTIFAKEAFHTIDGVSLSKLPHFWAFKDNNGDKESCLIFDSDGQLAHLSCEETRPFVCYRSESKEFTINECGTFDSEYHLDARTNKCYKFHPVPRIFTSAYFACAAEGGHLAIINSNTEAKVLTEIFAKYPERTLVGAEFKDVAFVGIHDWNEHGDWRTIHGQTLVEAGFSTFSSENPSNAPPGQYCGAIYRFGQLDDMFCDRAAAFFCEKSPDYNATCASLYTEW
ncbi:hypothetical protein PYW07_009903 [Mythimna separata]|uniref:C-type lectin domain-containing protein n=1 Tax=Mythimna separata TaxID=271217 RepID=A0AAD7YGI8_MYTSE|nr:hypothetical protein PYW07_009903 [Mythimna separata]